MVPPWNILNSPLICADGASELKGMACVLEGVWLHP
jgi:hypothetical protein